MEAPATTVALTPEERAVLEGDRGPLAAKVMRTVVLYADAVRAERLAEITGAGHFVVTCALPGIAPSLEMLDELVAAGLRTARPFTLDPLPPLDFDAWFLEPPQIRRLERMYAGQAAHMERLALLGSREADACTCTPYLPQVGNVPRRGDVLAWSESACVAFANSVLGARSNRNGAIVDLLCNLVGWVPLSGLLTDEGRRAAVRIEVAATELPRPQVLGAAIGRRVGAEVPYVVGLDRWLSAALDPFTRDYLHEVGAAAATAGAVGLFHVEGVTPEARDLGTTLLRSDAAECRVDDAVLRELEAGLVSLSSGPTPALAPSPSSRTHAGKAAAPRATRCIVGCPHLSLEQLRWWADVLADGLGEPEAIGSGRDPRGGPGARVRVPTTMAAAPGVLAALRDDEPRRRLFERAGVRLSAACPMQLFDDGLSDGQTVITNSFKLGAYTHALYRPDEEIVRILVGGPE